MMRRKARCWSLRALKQIHGLMVVRGFNSHLPALRELLSSLAALHGTLDYANKLFGQITDPDLFLWNTMIRGASHSSNPSQAISLYAHMKARSVKLDSFTFLFLLKACAKLSSAVAGAQFHGAIVKLGFGSDAFVRNALINLHASCGDCATASSLFVGPARRDVIARSALIAGYARRGELETARRLFDEDPLKDLVSWNIMINGYAKQGEMKRARDLFDRAPERDVISWNTMVMGYVRSGHHEQAWEVYEEMQRAGESPDEATMLSLLSSCAESWDLDIGQRICHAILERCSRSGLSLLLGNALIDMYGKCGSVRRALEVFRGIRERDLWTWNSIIGGLAFNGHAEESRQLFNEMLREKVRPNEITFVCVLTACSHAGMIEEGRRYFTMMTKEYGMEASIKHHGCMVDMLGRAGLLKEAFEFVGSMNIEPNPIIWRTLLGACQIHGNAKLGKLAAEQLHKMTQNASGDYVLLSNIYSSVGEWGRAEKMRRLMDDNKVTKNAAYTHIQAEAIEQVDTNPYCKVGCKRLVHADGASSP